MGKHCRQNFKNALKILFVLDSRTVIRTDILLFTGSFILLSKLFENCSRRSYEGTKELNKIYCYLEKLCHKI